MRSRCGTPMAGDGVIGGVERKIHFFAFDLPHSDACFVVGYPAETTEAFCDGHEGLVGYARRNFLVPLPVFESFCVFRRSRPRHSNMKPATDSDLKPARVPI